MSDDKPEKDKSRVATEKVVLSSRELDFVLSGMDVPDARKQVGRETQELATLPEEKPGDATPERAREALKACKIFHHLTWKEIEWLAEIARVSTAAAWSVIAERDVVLDAVTVIASGKVEATDGRRTTLELGPGACFGAEANVAFGPNPYRLVALGECTVVRLVRAELMAFMRREPVVAVKVLWGLAQDASDQLQALRKAMGEASAKKALLTPDPNPDREQP